MKKALAVILFNFVFEVIGLKKFYFILGEGIRKRSTGRVLNSQWVLGNGSYFKVNLVPASKKYLMSS